MRATGWVLPQFDNLSFTGVPGDAPTAVPDPCAAYSTWDSTYRINLLGTPVQAYDTLPAGAGCLARARAASQYGCARRPPCGNLRAARGAGVGSCDAAVAGRLYLQVCNLRGRAQRGYAQLATSNTMTLAASASSVNNAYVGFEHSHGQRCRPCQTRTISAYTGKQQACDRQHPMDGHP